MNHPGPIVFEDQFLRMYINQWVSGRSMNLQSQIARMNQQEVNIRQAREARDKRQKERAREGIERYAMSREDPKFQIQLKKAQEKRKKEFKKAMKRL
jgi:hypothetical protein